MYRSSLALGLAFFLLALPAFGQAPVPAAEVMPTLVSDNLFQTGAACPPRIWGEVDYLLWWIKPVCEPPATVSIGNPADAVPGAVGQPGTVTVMGKTRFEFPAASGVRPTLGFWLDDDQTYSIYGSGIILPRVSNTRTFNAGINSPPTYLNFVTPTGQNSAIPFTIPGLITGYSRETGSSGLWGAEINGLAQIRLENDEGYLVRGGLILGSRYMLLEDRVRLQNTQTLVVAPFTSASGDNRFATKNQFLGGQIGFQAAVECKCIEFEFTQKLAIGSTKMENTISGGPLVTGSQLAPGTIPGPLLALPSNTFRMTTERATLMPEVTAKIRYRVSDCLKISMGYNFLYWSRIFCPGDLMDPRVNLTQIPQFGPFTGTAYPTQSFARTDYFAQGLELGFQFEY